MLHAISSSIDLIVVAWPFVTLPGTVLGIMWLAQFEDLGCDKAIRTAIIWTVLVIPFSPVLDICAVVISISGVLAWCPVSLLTAVAAHRAFGGSQ
jgi:hypothetical protein